MMGRMLLSELLKIRRSRSLKRACIIYAALVLLSTLGTAGEQHQSGIMGPFAASSCLVPWSYWVIAAFSALTLGGEFDGKLFKNAFACGVSREKLYAVKVIGHLPCQLFPVHSGSLADNGDPDGTFRL